MCFPTKAKKSNGRLRPLVLGVLTHLLENTYAPLCVFHHPLVFMDPFGHYLNTRAHNLSRFRHCHWRTRSFSSWMYYLFNTCFQMLNVGRAFCHVASYSVVLATPGCKNIRASTILSTSRSPSNELVLQDVLFLYIDAIWPWKNTARGVFTKDRNTNQNATRSMHVSRSLPGVCINYNKNSVCVCSSHMFTGNPYVTEARRRLWC